MSETDRKNEQVSEQPVAIDPAVKPSGGGTKKTRANLLVAAMYAVVFVICIGILSLNIFRSENPHFRSAMDQAASVLESKAAVIDQALEKTVRYPKPGSLNSKDWRRDLLTEQTIWTDEIARLNLGTADAKPFSRKRQFLLYLGDSYYRDEPRFDQARAVYLDAALEPRSGKDFDIQDHELYRRIGYCSLRLGDFKLAEQYLLKALALCELNKTSEGKPAHMGDLNACLDNLAETYIRQGKLVEGQALLDRRLKAIDLKTPEFSVEPHLLFNFALLYDKKNDAVAAENYYKKTIAQFKEEDHSRGVIPDGDNDNNRNLARALREYARFLRAHDRQPESLDCMKQAFAILDRAP